MKNKKTFIKKVVLRILGFIFSMLILSIAVFYFARLAPGDPLQSFYGDSVETMNIKELQEAKIRLGLNEPIFIQYIKWLENVFCGDFGLSLKYKIPAMRVVSPLIGNTLVLGGTAYILMFIMAILLAVSCAINENSIFDRLICKAGTISYYVPHFWFGILLVLIFSINLKWFPSSGAYDVGKANDIINRVKHMVLPLIVMIMSHLWYYAYMVRNKLLDEVRKEYLLLAKAKGLKKSEIMWKHCLRNALPTIVNIMAISIPHILSGTYIAEAVFNYPGLGSLAIESAKYHDYNLLMLLVLITGFLVIFSSIIAKTINEIIDPRMKETEVSAWQK